MNAMRSKTNATPHQRKLGASNKDKLTKRNERDARQKQHETSPIQVRHIEQR
ncbi:MAG: hypothetical protein IJ684_02180 [Bacteroidales bacterium]|nr:hypothetical protein [Bacteroidales bacterium]